MSEPIIIQSVWGFQSRSVSAPTEVKNWLNGEKGAGLGARTERGPRCQQCCEGALFPEEMSALRTAVLQAGRLRLGVQLAYLPPILHEATADASGPDTGAEVQPGVRTPDDSL